jgi:hypothetical protein
MKMQKLTMQTMLIATFALLLATTPAWAYLDPGTGSMLLQVILGGAAAVGVAIKMFWHRIVAVFRPRSKDSAGTDAP